jgi:tetratricopeptide (TPR) repeat protein
VAFSSNRLGDSATARKFFETYFAKQKPDKIGPKDLDTYAKVLLKFPGNEALAASYVEKALALDTLEIDKVQHIQGIAAGYLTAKNYNEAAKWYARVLTVKKNYGKVDLYNAGWNYYKGSDYPSSVAIWNNYTQKYPDDIFGWYMTARASEGIDSTGAQGLAKPAYEKVIQYGLLDTAKNKSQVITAYNYLVAYNYNTIKDNAAACEFTKKILELDPNNNQSLENFKALCGGKIKTKTTTSGTPDKPKTEVKVKEKPPRQGTR